MLLQYRSLRLIDIVIAVSLLISLDGIEKNKNKLSIITRLQNEQNLDDFVISFVFFVN